MRKTLSTHSYFQYVLFIITSVLYLCVFSSYTSPLFNNYGGDSAFFMLMGKMFSAGKIPYVEFFDHKGPFLIFIQYIGLKLATDDRTGIFILQVINLFIVQNIIYLFARTYLSKMLSIAVVMLTLLVFSFTIQGGNSTEEWSLLYLYLCLWMTICFDSYSYCLSDILLLISA